MKKKYLSLFIFIPQEIVRESFPAAKRLEEGSQMCNVWSRLPFIFRVEDAGRRFGALLQSAKLNLPVTRCWHIWLPSLCAFGADDSSQLRKTWAKKREHSGLVMISLTSGIRHLAGGPARASDARFVKL
jgi:hypothetical protein